MRIFFVMMVLLNLGYFGWQIWLAKHAELDQASQSAAGISLNAETDSQNGVARLVLVSELPPGRVSRIDTVNSVSEPGEQIGRALPAPATTLVENALDAETASVIPVQVPATPAISAAPDIGGINIGDDEISAGGAGLIPPATAALCTSVDAINSAELRDQLLMLLEEESFSANVTTYEVPLSSTWWVHIPAFASEELAQRMLLELQAKSIDSYYMRSGELMGGISLGVFSRQESAVSAQAGLERRGYRTDIREIIRMQPVFKINTDKGLDALQSAPRVRLFLEANQGLEVSEIVCESVAQGIQFP